MGACAQGPDPRPQTGTKGMVPRTDQAKFRLFAACTPKALEGWETAAQEDGISALRAANCHVFPALHGTDRETRLAHARKGRKLAELAVSRLPKSARAHYLLAYLTGLEAENDSLHGLQLVPVIEREALAAAGLNPGLDHGGPDRMLGELYLQAPAFPLSIGDSAKSVAHFRRALDQDPDFIDNRLGLVEALLAEEKGSEACHELNRVMRRLKPGTGPLEKWRMTLDLLERLCREIDGRR